MSSSTATSSPRKIKVLACGPVLGSFRSLCTKLRTIQSSKAGPFDVCFCVGPFFGGNSEDKRKDASSLLDEDDDALSFPLAVYFTDMGNVPDGFSVGTGTCVDEAEIEIEEDTEGDNDDLIASKAPCVEESIPEGASKISKNLYHLGGTNGASDILTLHGLTVAYIAPFSRLGTPSVRPLEEKSRHPSYLGCDVLLSTEWGQGMTEGAFSQADRSRLVDAGVNLGNVGSYDVSEVASLVRPRYHFAASSEFLTYMHLASLPFHNPPLSAGGRSHICRFLALGNVLEAKEAKSFGKGRKYLHAVGVFPLIMMDRTLATEVPAGTLPHPYTDMEASSYGRGGMNPASARRLMMEDNAKSSQYRYNNLKRKQQHDDPEEKERQNVAAFDENNNSLFVHGLHKDPANLLNGVVLLEAFRPYGCLKIRIPPHKNTYGFLEFESHEKAKSCLEQLNGSIVLSGVTLTLKWSSGGTAPLGLVPPPPPSFPKRQKTRLTESEATESSTLFVHLPPDCHDNNETLEQIRSIAEQALEEAIQKENPSEEAPITARDEPALAVSSRQPSNNQSYAFLSFASHAAAIMSIAALTSSTDGGNISLQTDAITVQDTVLIDKLQGASLYWAKGDQSHHQRTSPPARDECWFCLASPTCEKHFILSVRSECYIAMPKGGLDPFHAIILPVKHLDVAELGAVKEVWDVRDELRKHAHEKLQKDLFVFERAFRTKGGYHAHFQCIPIEKGLGETLLDFLRTMAKEVGFELKDMEEGETIPTTEKKEDEEQEEASEPSKHAGYFYAEVPLKDGKIQRLLHVAKAKDEKERAFGVPLQFGREAVASAMEKPEMAHWKSCVLDLDQETELANTFRQSLGGSTINSEPIDTEPIDSKPIDTEPIDSKPIDTGPKVIKAGQCGPAE